MKCSGQTKTGKPCRRAAVPGSSYCPAHLPEGDLLGDEPVVFWGDLNAKEKAFVSEYLTSFNLTRAAQAYGYYGERPSTFGVTVLKRKNVRACVGEAAEELFMSLEEARKRISDMARASLEPFLKVDDETLDVSLDITNPEARRHLHLVKKLKIHKREVADVTYETTEFELHDAKDALDKILKLRGAYAPERISIQDSRQDPDAPKTLDEWYDQHR